MAVEFEEPKYAFERRNFEAENRPQPPLVKLAIRMKLARTAVQANVVLLVISALAIVLSIICLKTFVFNHKVNVPPDSIYIK